MRRRIWLTPLLAAGLAISIFLVLSQKSDRVESPSDSLPPTISTLPEAPSPSIPAVSPSPSPIPTPSPTPIPQSAEIHQLLEQTCHSENGTWDLWVEPLSPSGTPVFASNISEGEPMVSASIIKLFVMATVYDQIQQGLLSHGQCYDLIYSMITVSDNYATNELIRLLGNGDNAAGMNAVNRYAEELGCNGTQLNRLMLAGNGLENYTTAEDCARILRMLYEGTCVSTDWSAEMLSILKQQTVNNRIPANLPGIVCAHKTGDLIALCCADVGIIYTPQGDYILCAICNDPGNDYAAAESIALLSDNVYQILAGTD